MDPVSLITEPVINEPSQHLLRVHFSEEIDSSPTLVARKPFDPSYQAELLHEATKGIGKLREMSVS
jgi:hypothetical protein